MSQEHAFGIGDSVRPLVRAVFEPDKVRTASTDDHGAAVAIPALNALALRSLVCLFNAKENLFSRRITIAENGFNQEKTSRRRTIIALLGLQRLAQSRESQPFDLAAIRDVVLEDTSWVRGVGDLGLLTWFTAEFAPEKLCELFSEFDFDKVLEICIDGRQARTSGLAMFLAGISHARLAAVRTLVDLTDIAVDVYRLLLDNKGESGVFCQAAHPGFLQRSFCRRFGTFDDQICAIYALSTFAKAFKVEEPLASALSCANSIRALQGEMGEWWFLYDKRTCRVVSRYPVFSWHQDGTAPVGLLALEETTGQSFHEPVYKGLSWVTKTNELGDDLRSLERGLIWDSIRPRRQSAVYWEGALSLANISRRSRSTDLRIQYESRPDHFGWLLYAFGRHGLPKANA